MTVYLLHMQQPLSRGVSPAGKPLQAGHYIGFSQRGELSARMAEHMSGQGARFTQVCLERGIAWQLARVWEGPRADRRFERKLKNRKEAPRLCPICNPHALNCAQL